MIHKPLFIFIIVFFTVIKIQAEEVIHSVKYLKPNAFFSETSDIYIQDGIISRIIASKQNKAVHYVIPSFCDAYVTLGADAMGGQNNIYGIRLALKSFLLHGFTHIQSVADGPWIFQIKAEIDSGKILGPKITISNKPMIPKSSETKDISEYLFFQADTYDSTLNEMESQVAGNNKIIHVLNRHNEDEVFSFDSRVLNDMRLKANERKKNLTIHTFADRVSILDALISGNRYLVHPILFEIQKELTRQHIKELHLIPILNVYRNLHFDDTEDDAGLFELKFLQAKSKFFYENYSLSYKSSLKLDTSEEEFKNRLKEYSSYLKFIKRNPVIHDNLILGSGSGNRLSFPGVSGIQELKILAQVLDLSENLFYIPTRNSCSYLGGSYSGVLAVGTEANLLVLKENPIENIDTLFQIEQVYQNGKPVKFDLPAKKIKKKR